MDMATHFEITEVVNLIKRLPNSPITDKIGLDETVRLFLAVLGDLPAETIKTATIQYLSEGNPFFPTPGAIRDKAMELQMLALGIPTPAEAWGMVLTARQYVEPVFCAEGWRSRSTGDKANEEYWKVVKESRKHDDECTSCRPGGFQEIYGHNAVAETVRLLGGRDIILTDNPVADRARFIEAYREVVARERMKMAMTPRVSQFIEQSQHLLEDDQRAALDTGESAELSKQMKRLTARLEK